MSSDFLYNNIRQYKYAVLSTVSKDNAPESAVVGFVITPDLKVFFDTLADSKKYRNLLLNPKISFVFGWDHAQTVQYEGIAKVPTQEELKIWLPKYFELFPDGIERNLNSNDITYFYVEPKWIRFSDFNESKAKIEELKF